MFESVMLLVVGVIFVAPFYFITRAIVKFFLGRAEYKTRITPGRMIIPDYGLNRVPDWLKDAIKESEGDQYGEIEF